MERIIIRKAIATDLERLVRIYDYAREFMAQTGNPGQWINGYPSLDDLRNDLEHDCLYVCCYYEEGYQDHCGDNSDKRQHIIAAFCFMPGPDPTYSQIENGQWLNDLPYHVIHRLASDGSHKGIAKACLDWCLTQDTNVRVDTHKDNLIMQHILESYGFQQCGMINTHDGTPRLAYQTK